MSDITPLSVDATAEPDTFDEAPGDDLTVIQDDGES